MARLCIKATPSADLRRYELRIDETDVPMEHNDEGCVDIGGTCGDGSSHRLYYVLVGDVGATLGIEMTCDDEHGILMPGLEVFPPGPVMDGDVEFEL